MTCATMAVLCGGKGTRLGELTKSTPKSLIEVAGRPFLEWPLEHYASQGIQRVVLCIGHLGGLISRHFGDSFAGMELAYSWDSPPLGVTGALAKAAADLLGPCYWWAYGDTYLPLDLPELKHSCRWWMWNDGFAVGHRAGWVEYGLYYRHPTSGLEEKTVPKEQRFYEIGTPAALAETRAYFLDRLSGTSRSDFSQVRSACDL